jgi:hypothetical protein
VTTIRDSEQPVWASILWRAWEANFVVKTSPAPFLAESHPSEPPEAAKNVPHSRFPGEKSLNWLFFVNF